MLASGSATLVVLGLISIATYWSFTVRQTRELDRELIARVQHEADNIVHSDGVMTLVEGEQLRLNALDDHVKYAALYGKRGEVIAQAPTFGAVAPTRAELPDKVGAPFNLDYGERQLRAVMWEVKDGQLLLAASRSFLIDDSRDLRNLLALLFAMGAVLSIAGAGLVASRLTRSIEHVTEVARAITNGALDARVQPNKLDTSTEVASLGADLNRMVDSLRLALNAEKVFVSNAAHELRSPLTVLRGELELTLRRERSADDYRVAIREALENARALQALAEDLLDLARTRMSAANEALSCDVAEAMQQALRTGVLRDAEDRGVRVVVDVPHVQVRGRIADVSRLFRNVLDNAVEHAPKGTEIIVGARRSPDAVDITIEDQGAGVGADVAAHLFEPFSRGGEERTRSGAGLGLAIARAIAEQAGGSLTLESARAPTRFLVHLPSA